MSSYVVWVYLGLAETEEVKINREAPWSRCFALLDPLFRPFGKKATVLPQLVYEVPQAARKSDPPGTRRVTYKKVPTGRLKWSEPDRQRLTGWFTEPSEWPVIHVETTVVSDAGKACPPEVLVRVLNREASATSLFNQVLILAVTEERYTAQPAAEWERLSHDLADLMQAVRGSTVRPALRDDRTPGNATVLSSLMDASFTLRHDSLELDENWQRWEILR